MNKIAFITGGTRGIGFGVALALGKAGFDLAVNGQRIKIIDNQFLIYSLIKDLTNLIDNFFIFQAPNMIGLYPTFVFLDFNQTPIWNTFFNRSGF